MSRTYLASSWRNPYQPAVLASLKAIGEDFQVYDFRNPGPDDPRFSWSQIDPNWQSWDFATYKKALEHKIANKGFRNDERALENCDICILVLPCGRSAHLELGWAAGAKKHTAVLFPGKWSKNIELNLVEGTTYNLEGLSKLEPELMYKLNGLLTDDPKELIDWAYTRHLEVQKAYPKR
jgi:nucleoside 2-deoxyribosyltransferase